MGAKMFLQQPDKAEGSEESRHAFYQLSTVVIAAGGRRPTTSGGDGCELRHAQWHDVLPPS